MVGIPYQAAHLDIMYAIVCSEPVASEGWLAGLVDDLGFVLKTPTGFMRPCNVRTAIGWSVICKLACKRAGIPSASRWATPRQCLGLSQEPIDAQGCGTAACTMSIASAPAPNLFGLTQYGRDLVRLLTCMYISSATPCLAACFACRSVKVTDRVVYMFRWAHQLLQ